MVKRETKVNKEKCKESEKMQVGEPAGLRRCSLSCAEQLS